MAQNRGSKVVSYLLVFVAGLAGTACLLLLTSGPLRCLLAYRAIDAGVALVMVLLVGLGAALITLLPHETRRIVVSLYAGVAVALVGFVVAAWLSPSPAANQCSALASAGTVARPTEPGVPLPAVTGLPSPTPITFHSVIPTPAAGPESGAGCVTAAGGRAYFVRPGDRLELLAERFATSTESLMEANCLESRVLIEGQLLYVPDLRTDVVCAPRAEWPRYLVRSGDTLFGIAGRAGVTVQQLQRANCLAGTLVIAGTYLRVPRLPSPPTSPPRPTATAMPTATSTPRPN